MGEILSFFLCGSDGRLAPSAVATNVFHVLVASPAVASFIVSAGPKHCARFGLGFHGALDSAVGAAAELSAAAPPVIRSHARRRRRPKPVWSHLPAFSVGFGGEGLLPLPRAQVLASLPSPNAVPSEVSSSFKEDASSAPLSPYAGVPRPAHAALEPSAIPGSPATRSSAEINAPTSPAPRSYLEAARCPAAPQPKTPSAPLKTLNLSLDGCFRCLSSLHLVRECRDPIRCRGCGRSGHRLRECTMPFPQPTFVPTITTPSPPAAPRRPATPYPSALPSPLPFSVGGRRARSASPARRASPLFEVGESSRQNAAPALERVIPMVEPPRQGLPDPGPLAVGEEEVESDDSAFEPPAEVFMPPGDMEAARRMAVVFIDALPPFTSPSSAFAEAIFTELPGLHVTGVGSSIGDLYARFLSEDDRELAMLHQPFHLDGATFRLVREEEADRIPCDMPWVALVLARRVPVEHLSNLGVAASFSSFGETLEVDAASLTGTDCAAVRAVVRLKRERFVPNEVLLSRKPWGSRLITIRKIRVWRLQDSYDSDGEYVPFFRMPPPPLFHRRHGGLPLVPARLPPAPHADDESRGERGGGDRDDALDNHAALLAMLDSVASSPGGSLPSPPRSSSSSASLTITWCSVVGSEGGADSLRSGPPLAVTRRRGVVITELDSDSDAPPMVSAGGDASVPPPPQVKRSSRLALKEPPHYEPVEARAMKLRGLKDALGSCTAALQKQVHKHSALAAHAKPLRKRAVAALAASICAFAPSVPTGDDV
ncbi:hypothetical protein ACQ4PT_068131 [Festuca glaucescens]